MARLEDLRWTAPVEWPQLAAALLHVARDAVQLGDWIFAKQCLTESMAAARRTGQHDVVFSAEALLRDVGKELNREVEVHAIAANEDLAKHAVRLLMKKM